MCITDPAHSLEWTVLASQECTAQAYMLQAGGRRDGRDRDDQPFC
jgi:hypothetical protein